MLEEPPSRWNCPHPGTHRRSRSFRSTPPRRPARRSRSAAYGKEEGGEGEAHEPDGKLYATTLTAISSDACRNSVGINSAVLLCAESHAHFGDLSGDSGGPLTEACPAVQVGIVDFGPKECPVGQPDGFSNIAAPEIRAFIEGSESPPVAPREVSSPAMKWFGRLADRVHPAHLRTGRVERVAFAQLHLPGGKCLRADAPERAGQRVRTPRQPRGLRRRVHRATGDQLRRHCSTDRSQATPAIVADTTPPNAAIRGLKCHLRSCALSFAAWDPQRRGGERAADRRLLGSRPGA